MMYMSSIVSRKSVPFSIFYVTITHYCFLSACFLEERMAVLKLPDTEGSVRKLGRFSSSCCTAYWISPATCCNHSTSTTAERAQSTFRAKAHRSSTATESNGSSSKWPCLSYETSWSCPSYKGDQPSFPSNQGFCPI